MTDQHESLDLPPLVACPACRGPALAVEEVSFRACPSCQATIRAILRRPKLGLLLELLACHFEETAWHLTLLDIALLGALRAVGERGSSIRHLRRWLLRHDINIPSWAVRRSLERLQAEGLVESEGAGIRGSDRTWRAKNTRSSFSRMTREHSLGQADTHRAP